MHFMCYDVKLFAQAKFDILGWINEFKFSEVNIKALIWLVFKLFSLAILRPIISFTSYFVAVFLLKLKSLNG